MVGFSIAMTALDGGRVNIGACSLGGAQACLGLARDHIKVPTIFNTLFNFILFIFVFNYRSGSSLVHHWPLSNHFNSS